MAALRKLEEQEKEEAVREEEEREKDLAQIKAREAKRHLEDAILLEDVCKDGQIERLHVCRSDNKELILTEEEFTLLREMIRTYSGNTERSDAQSIWFKARERKERSLAQAVLEMEARRKETVEKRKVLEAELEALPLSSMIPMTLRLGTSRRICSKRSCSVS